MTNVASGQDRWRPALAMRGGAGASARLSGVDSANHMLPAPPTMLPLPAATDDDAPHRIKE